MNFMTDQTTLDFASVQAILTSESVEMHAAEVHGVMTGLVSAGYIFEDSDYIIVINDMLNNSEGFPAAVKNTLKEMFNELWKNILDDSYSFQIMLPDDDETIMERANGLGHWVQGFNLGFGLQQKNKAKLSEDVQEVLNDFVDIANLSDEMEEDEDTEQAFYEIAEYVRISALLCFTELGVPPESSQKEETLH
jgi:yecA family protein